jgi:hypothetical protein
MLRHKCPLCFRYDNDPHKHLLVGHDYTALITHPDYAETNLSEGSRVCCNHFEPHSRCDQVPSSKPTSYIGHFQHVQQLSSPTRAKRKRLQISPSDDPHFHSSSTSKRSYSLLDAFKYLTSFFLPHKLDLPTPDQMVTSPSEFDGIDPTVSSSRPNVPIPETVVRIANVNVNESIPAVLQDTESALHNNAQLLRQLEDANHRLQELEAHQQRANAEIERHQLQRDALTQQFNQLDRDTRARSSFRQLLVEKSEKLAATRGTPIGSPERLSYEENLRALTGLNDADEVIALLLTYWERDPRGQKGSYAREEWLFLFLMWFWNGWTKKWLALFCRLDNTTVGSKMMEILKAVFSWARGSFELPDLDSWDRSTSARFKEVFPNTLAFYVDGTVVPIFKPYNNEAQKKAFNGKHKLHALVFTILVTENGRIVWVSSTDLGNTHDATAWNKSDICKALIDKYSEFSTDPNCPQFIIGADKAYPRVYLPGGWKVVVTKTARDFLKRAGEEEILPIHNRLPDVDPSNMDPNTSRSAEGNSSVISATIAEFRSNVERTFAVIKKWKILLSKYATAVVDRVRAHQLIVTVCALANRNIINRVQNQQQAENQ